MNDKINDGGPAFPGPCQSETTLDINEGLSLRDYFAAKAMHAVMSTPKLEFGHISADDVSLLAYQMADAMILARQS